MISKTDRNFEEIVNLAQNSTSKDKVLAFVRRRLSLNKKFTIFTPNPEIVLLASKNQRLASILLSSNILLNDGFGLTLAYDFLQKKKYKKSKFVLFFIYLIQGIYTGFSLIFSENKRILKGRDFFMELMKMGNRLGLKVFLLGGESDEALETKEKLEVSLKKVKIEAFKGPMLNRNAIPLSRKEYWKEKEALKRINSFSPDLLFVAFGAPKQEYWISKHMSELKTKGIMAVGGVFNYVSGNMSLPLKFFEKTGLEWFWRLILEPKRIVRIIRAVIIFPFKVYLYKVNS